MPSLHKFSFAGFCLVCTLLFAASNANADTVTTFNISGTVTPGVSSSLTGKTFSGTLTIDITNGTITALDIIFPGLPAFNTLQVSAQTDDCIILESKCFWLVSSSNPPNLMEIIFRTTPTPGSLVGFTGSTAVGGGITNPALCCTELQDLYTINSGSITPASTAAPEPSSIALTLLGIAAVPLLGKRLSQAG